MVAFAKFVTMAAKQIQLLLDKFTVNPKLLFLIDSLGAFVTAVLVGSVLTSFEDSFGMPQKALNYLSLAAYLFSTYSICCHFFTGRNWQSYLKAIAMANFTYCIVTVGLLYSYYPILTVLDLIYFGTEIVIVGGLVAIELKLATSRF